MCPKSQRFSVSPGPLVAGPVGRLGGIAPSHLTSGDSQVAHATLPIMVLGRTGTMMPTQDGACQLYGRRCDITIVTHHRSGRGRGLVHRGWLGDRQPSVWAGM